MAYTLDLLMKLLSIYDVFHVFILKRYKSDPSYVIQKPKIEISERLTYMELSIKILDQKVKWLRNKGIPIVKVKWSYCSPK